MPKARYLDMLRKTQPPFLFSEARFQTSLRLGFHQLVQHYYVLRINLNLPMSPSLL